MGAFCLLVELHWEGSAPAGCTSKGIYTRLLSGQTGNHSISSSLICLQVKSSDQSIRRWCRHPPLWRVYTGGSTGSTEAVQQICAPHTAVCPGTIEDISPPPLSLSLTDDDLHQRILSEAFTLQADQTFAAWVEWSEMSCDDLPVVT